MIRLIPASFFFALAAAYAQNGGAEAPVETASPAVIIAFLILFVGTCVLYVWVTWRKEKKNKQTPSAEPKEAGKA